MSIAPKSLCKPTFNYKYCRILVKCGCSIKKSDHVRPIHFRLRHWSLHIYPHFYFAYQHHVYDTWIMHGRHISCRMEWNAIFYETSWTIYENPWVDEHHVTNSSLWFYFKNYHIVVQITNLGACMPTYKVH